MGDGIPPYEQIQMRISVNLKGGAKSGEVNEATVSGGGAPGCEQPNSRSRSVKGRSPFGVSDI